MKLGKSRIFKIVVAMSSILLLAGIDAMAIEKSRYRVLESNSNIELRVYPPQVVAETLVEADFDDAGNEGFRRLYDYISGNNRTRPSMEITAPVTQGRVSRKIAMTAPVAQERTGEVWRITFMMPSEYSLAELPNPGDERVVLTQDPERTMAAIKYSGTWSSERYLANKALLEAFIAKRNLTKVGEPVWARYDPPFMPWFLRRNEILIPITF